MYVYSPEMLSSKMKQYYTVSRVTPTPLFHLQASSISSGLITQNVLHLC